jgi:hypothetical protein
MNNIINNKIFNGYSVYITKETSSSNLPIDDLNILQHKSQIINGKKKAKHKKFICKILPNLVKNIFLNSSLLLDGNDVLSKFLLFLLNVFF